MLANGRNPLKSNIGRNTVDLCRNLKPRSHGRAQAVAEKRGAGVTIHAELSSKITPPLFPQIVSGGAEFKKIESEERSLPIFLNVPLQHTLVIGVVLQAKV